MTLSQNCNVAKPHARIRVMTRPPTADLRAKECGSSPLRPDRLLMTHPEPCEPAFLLVEDPSHPLQDTPASSVYFIQRPSTVHEE